MLYLVTTRRTAARNAQAALTRQAFVELYEKHERDHADTLAEPYRTRMHRDIDERYGAGLPEPELAFAA